MRKIVIIGNGISGITTARMLRKKSDDQIVIISEESEYFFSRTALMYVFMGQMKMRHTEPYERSFYKKNRLELIQNRVVSIDFERRIVHFKDDEQLNYDELVLALGSKPKCLDVAGSSLSNIQGLYSKQDLELLESKRKEIKKAVIVGGGLIGVELAEMMHYQNIEVDVIIRESTFWGNVLSKSEGDFISEYIRSKGIRLHFNDEIDCFLGDAKVSGVRTKAGKEFDCDFVGLTIGVEPNVNFLENTELEMNKGVLIDANFKTNLENVYAVGDCAEFQNALKGRQKMEQIWYTGKLQGKQLGLNLALNEANKYNPGPWFNSAKFFDIEFQNYGSIGPEIDSKQDEFIWSFDNKMIRLLWEKKSDLFIGINAFGIRYRHELFDSWLRNGATIVEVLQNLSTANFDAEFSKKFEKEIIAEFNRKTGRNIELKKKKWYKRLIHS